MSETGWEATTHGDAVRRPKTETETTWFTVKRDYSAAGFDHPWVIMCRTMSNLHAQKGRFGGGFATRVEGEQYGKDRGWILVDSVKEARGLATPEWIIRAEKRHQFAVAREGLTRIRLGDPTGEGVYRYVTFADAERILAMLGEPDEFGRAGEAASR